MKDPNPTRQEEPRDPKVKVELKFNSLSGITDERDHQPDSQHIEKLSVVEEKIYHDGK